MAGLVLEKGRGVLCIYKKVLTITTRTYSFWPIKDQARFSLSIFPLLLRKTCPRYPALDKERFRCLHTGLFMIIIVIYVRYAIQRQTI